MAVINKGRRAESAVAAYLRTRGYLIICSNWRTRTCEIDLVAYKDKVISFIEVKFRSSTNQGIGFDYITAAKKKQMAYAAELWVAKNNWRGQYLLGGASVSGEGEIEFIESIV